MYSTLIYLIVFSIAILLFYISEHLVEKQKKFTNIFAFLAIIIVCLLAGFRNIDVGVDVKVYIANNLKIVTTLKSLKAVLINDNLNIGIEYIYGILLFLCSRFKNAYIILLFLIQFLTITPIYLSAFFIKNKYKSFDLTLSMASYLFLYFNNSLNCMRQSVAIAFIILGVTLFLLDKNNKKKSLFLFLFAIFFHNSAILGLILIYLINLIYEKKDILSKIARYISVIAIILLPIIITIIFEKLLNLGILSDKFIYYADIFLYKSIAKDWFVNPFSLYSLAFVFFIFAFSFFMFFNNKLNNKTFHNSLLSIIVLYGYAIYLIFLFYFKTMYGIRITLYLDMFNILALPMSIGTRYKKESKFVCYFLIVLCWLITIIKLGWSGSNNYNFIF